MSATEVRERVSVRGQNGSRQHTLALGFIFAPFCSCTAWSPTCTCLFLPYPTPLYCFPSLIALLPIFSSFLISFCRFFFFFFLSLSTVFPPASLSSLHLLPSLFGSSATAPLPATEKLLNFLHMQNQPRHSGALSPSVDQKSPQFDLLCSRLTPSTKNPAVFPKGELPSVGALDPFACELASGCGHGGGYETRESRNGWVGLLNRWHDPLSQSYSPPHTVDTAAPSQEKHQ